MDFLQPVGISTGAPSALDKIQTIIQRAASEVYSQSVAKNGKAADVVNAIQTVLGWDTILRARRPLSSSSPVSQSLECGVGGYVLFDWDTFLPRPWPRSATGIWPHANAIEILRSETQQGFVLQLRPFRRLEKF